MVLDYVDLLSERLGVDMQIVFGAPIVGGVEDLRGKRFAVVKHLFVYSKSKKPNDI